MIKNFVQPFKYDCNIITRSFLKLKTQIRQFGNVNSTRLYTDTFIHEGLPLFPVIITHNNKWEVLPPTARFKFNF
jgi:hypothetical protein